MRALSLILFLTALAVNLYGQESHGIRIKPRKCKNFDLLYERLPSESRFGIDVINSQIFIVFRGRPYFEKFINSSKDGFAIDIVHRDQFPCESPNHRFGPIARGTLLEPIYKGEVMKRVEFSSNGYAAVPYGPLSSEYDLAEVELNLLILQKKSLCKYITAVGVEHENWDLIEMGLYRDSISDEQFRREHLDVTKKLSLTIPFEWNQGEFDPADIKPLYDSLHLTDYNITDIFIDAYTSIEGSTDINEKLQQERAASIVQALQKYQTPEINSFITTRENWVEFYRDLEGTPFQSLLEKSDQEIKSILAKDVKLLSDIEPILKNHRKAMIDVFLEKRFTLEERDPDKLRSYFDHSIQSGDLDQAMYLHQVISRLVEKDVISPEVLTSLEIPERSEYGPLLNAAAVNAIDLENLDSAISSFERLHKILPESAMVRYNLVALKMDRFRSGIFEELKEEIQLHIRELERSKFNPILLSRLKVNFQMLLVAHHDLRLRFKYKNRALREVNWAYKQTQLTDQDRVRLARFLANYSAFGWAQEVLKPRINDVDASEDLLFYYFRLTFSDYSNHRNQGYQVMLQNAIHKNERRFCDLFLSINVGGYSFQLLNSPELKRLYCLHCE